MGATILIFGIIAFGLNPLRNLPGQFGPPHDDSNGRVVVLRDASPHGVTGIAAASATKPIAMEVANFMRSREI